MNRKPKNEHLLYAFLLTGKKINLITQLQDYTSSEWLRHKELIKNRHPSINYGKAEGVW
jgi:hypothetical protein